jgi:NAD(P)-dependent dehydrogenase (short-subunit alcohol dehydrogenase family)
MPNTQQKPINSGFGHQSTARDIVSGLDLHGQHFIVTGGYSGLGLESVRALAGAGASIIVPARSRVKAEAELSAVSGDIEIADLDLGDLTSVRKFADEYVSTGRPLHGLINNAGIMACPLARVGNGWESQFGICHLGHFELTRRLEKPLKDTQGARVVSLSSTAHIMSDVHWDDPHFNDHEYDKWQAYGQAKSSNALFARGLDQKWQGDDVRAFSVHPGGIFTPLQRHLSDEEMAVLGWKNLDGTIPDHIKAMFKTPEQGGATALWCALSPSLDGMGGVYCEDCDIAPMADDNSQRFEHAREWICDPHKAERLWEMSETMVDAG